MKTFFYITPDIENPFFAVFGALLQRRLTRAGANLWVLNSDNSIADELANIKTCERQARAGELAGIVFISSGENIESYRKLREIAELPNGAGRFPIVVVDREIADSEHLTCNILCDNDHGIKIALEHLVDYGHHKIGFLTGALNTDPGKIRLSAFRSTSKALELEVREDWIVPGNFTFSSGVDAANKFADLPVRERPTSILCSNDLSAAGFIQQAAKRQISVPQDISVIGFDGSPLSQWLSPPLTTVSQPLEHMAEMTEFVLLTSTHGEEVQAKAEETRPQTKVHWAEPTLTKRLSVRDLGRGRD